MITTSDLHEVKPFPFMRTPGFKTWRTAGLDVWRPYFLLSYACKEGRTWISQAMILWCEQDLKGFCEQARDGGSTRIYRITRLVPPEPGQSEMWHTVSIKQIWHRMGGSEQDELLFVAEGHARQFNRTFKVHPSSQQMKKIFDAS